MFGDLSTARNVGMVTSNIAFCTNAYLLRYIVLMLFLASCGIGTVQPEEVPISGAVIVNDQLTVINQQPPFVPTRKIQWICGSFSQTISLRQGDWRPIVGGEPVTILIQVINENGVTSDMNRTVALSDKLICFENTPPDESRDVLPRNHKYDRVLVWSNQPVTFSRLYWYGYDPEDRK
jgi:hypothetical protein